MCGIVGYYSSSPTEEDRSHLINIFTQSKVRGLHAFGYSHLSPELSTHKFLEFDKLIDSIFKMKMPNKLIGHLRYSTSGDYKDINNNQPLHFSDMSLVFNGVLNMSTKEEMEQQFQEKFETYNDGEIFIKHLFKNKDAQEFIDSCSGSFAGCWIKDREIFAIRNYRRPMWYAKINNSVFIASTADIFKRSNILDCRQIIHNKIIKLSDL